MLGRCEKPESSRVDSTIFATRSATNPVLNGVDLVTVKEPMGHADISITMRYAHPTPESKRGAVEGLVLRRIESSTEGGKLGRTRGRLPMRSGTWGF